MQIQIIVSHVMPMFANLETPLPQDHQHCMRQTVPNATVSRVSPQRQWPLTLLPSLCSLSLLACWSGLSFRPRLASGPVYTTKSDFGTRPRLRCSRMRSAVSDDSIEQALQERLA